MKHLQANKKHFTGKELAEIQELNGDEFQITKRVKSEMYLINTEGRAIILPDNPEYETGK